ncbi:MAG TPA: hypothetical protein VGF96_08760 [Terracidiphilus sp.]
MKQMKRINGSCAPPRRFRRLRWQIRGCVAALFLTAMVTADAQAPQSSQPQSSQSSQPQANGSTSTQDPGRGRASVSSPLAVPGAQNGQNLDAMNARRKKQLATESATLLKLATELKAEVDKSTKDTLSVNVIRKADEIEKLAHSVKENMKSSVGPG